MSNSMSNSTSTKPLDLSKPLQTLDGQKVRILCTDAIGSHPIVGLILRVDGSESPAAWRLDGSFGYGWDRPNPGELVNVPEPPAGLTWSWARTVWVNIYMDAHGQHYFGTRQYATREEAVAKGRQVRATPDSYIACKEITYRIGDGVE